MVAIHLVADASDSMMEHYSLMVVVVAGALSCSLSSVRCAVIKYEREHGSVYYRKYSYSHHGLSTLHAPARMAVPL